MRQIGSLCLALVRACKMSCNRRKTGSISRTTHASEPVGGAYEPGLHTPRRLWVHGGAARRMPVPLRGMPVPGPSPHADDSPRWEGIRLTRQQTAKLSSPSPPSSPPLSPPSSLLLLSLSPSSPSALAKTRCISATSDDIDPPKATSGGHHPPPCVGADRSAARCDLRS